MSDEKPAPTPAPDLLERARSEAVNWSATCGRLFDELADEIERQRVELEKAARKLEYEIAWRKTAIATARAVEREDCARKADK